MKKVFAFVTMAALVMTSGCAFGADAFKIGGTGPLTGGAAIYGNAAKNGAQIAVDEINASGSAVKFELHYEDDTHDAEKAVNAYNALKDWGMQISLGSVTSKPCEATAAETFADRISPLPLRRPLRRSQPIRITCSRCASSTPTRAPRRLSIFPTRSSPARSR